MRRVTGPTAVGAVVPRFRRLAAVAIALLAAACSGQPDAGAAAPGQRPRTDGPAEDAELRSGDATALSPVTGLLLGRPIYPGDFADPFVLRVGDRFFAYATNTRDVNVPVMVVEGSPIASYLGEALPELPAWSEPGAVWAPAVLATDDGYVLYYTTRVSGTTTQCISSAVAASPAGPFVDSSAEPMVCQRDLGGSIDPSVVVEADGTEWLLFKNDGNCCDLPTSIWVQRLGPDHRSLVGSPTRLIDAAGTWDGGLIEGPSMVLAGGRVYLFYSGNAWDSANYGIGYAVCESITGPCHRPEGSDEPWMDSTTFASGPGGQEFFSALGDVWMVYHGWSGGAGEPEGERRLYVDVIAIDDGVPRRLGARRTWTVTLLLVVAVAAAGGAAVRWRRRRLRPSARRTPTRS